MKTWYLFIFLVIASLSAAAQNTKPGGCDLFGPLHFNKGVARATIKAFCTDLTESLPPIKGQTEKNSKIKFSDYYTWFKEVGYSGSDVVFLTDNCQTQQTALLAKKAIFKNAYIGKYIRLNCLVFDNKRFADFVVTNVSLLARDNKPAQSILPLKYFIALNNQEYISYFGNGTGALTRGTAIMGLNHDQTAYVKTDGGKTLYFKRETRTETPTGYVDVYKSDSGTIKLDVDRIVMTNPHMTLRFGHIWVSLPKATVSTDVFGIDEEQDKFNGY